MARGRLVALLLVSASAAVACSTTPEVGLPDDATVAEFCDIWDNVDEESLWNPEEEKSYVYRDLSDAINEVGTPDDASRLERQGLQHRLEMIDAYAGEDESIPDRWDEVDEDPEAWEAFGDYVERTCRS